MNISLTDPLSRAFSRMKMFLFKPFDISRWFIVGFSAFLAGLVDWNPGAGGKYNLSDRKFNSEDIFALPGMVWEWLSENPVWFTLMIIGLFLIFILVIVLTWLSSRGKFIFLDNVVTGSAKIVEPWHKYKRSGNSLFLWRLVFGFICFVMFVILFLTGFIIMRNLYEESSSTGTYIISIIGLVLTGLVIFIICQYISLFLNDFVVPIMYQQNLSTTSAWHAFLKIFSQHIFWFLLYGIFIFVLFIGVAIAFIFIGLFTCCIGFLLLIIPYLSSVITLPISYTFRAYSLEFLAQFGEEFNLFHKEEPLPEGM